MLNDGLEFRVSAVEKDIEEINGELKELKTEMRNQENRLEAKIEEGFKQFEAKLDKNNESQNLKSDNIFQALTKITDGQHRQELENLKTNNILSSLEHDRDTQREENKKMKWLIWGIAGSLATTLITTIGRLLLNAF